MDLDTEQATPAPSQRPRRPRREEELPDRYLETVLRFVAARIGYDKEAEDIVLDTFVAAVEGWHRRPRRRSTAPDDDPIRAWMIGIAWRKLGDAGRVPRTLPLEESSHLVDPTQDPLEIVLRQEEREMLLRCLARLSAEHREALLFKYMDGFSLAEVAQLLGRTRLAVGSLLHRARLALATLLGPYYREDVESKDSKDSQGNKGCKEGKGSKGGPAGTESHTGPDAQSGTADPDASEGQPGQEGDKK